VARFLADLERRKCNFKMTVAPFCN
jgi:hypothetical protein